MKWSCLFLASLFMFGTTPCLADDNANWLSPVVGEGYGVQVKEGRTSDAELRKIKAAGLRYVRFVSPWAVVEEEKGEFDWGYFEKFIQRLRKLDLNAVVVLGGGHPDYTGYIDAPKDNIDHTDRYLIAPATPEAIEKFSVFAAKTVEHIGSQNIVWELWNEPDSDRFWAPRANVHDYISVAERACRAIKAVDPKARVIGPGMADMPGRWGTLRAGFLGTVLQSSLSGCLDAISLHPYRDGEVPPETVLSAHEKLQTFIRTYTPKGKPILPVCSTEWGFTLTDTSPEQQAAFLLRSFMLNTMAGVPISIWYEWRDAREGADDPEAHFGLLTLDQKEKASYKALADFLPPLLGAKLEKRIKGPTKKDFLLQFKNKEGKYFLVFWSTDGQTGTRVKVAEKAGSEVKEYALTAMPQRVDCGNTEPKLTLLH